MKLKSIIFCVFVLFLTFIGGKTNAQHFSPYFTIPQYENYTGYLMNGDHIKMYHYLDQPYTVDQIYDSLGSLDEKFNQQWCGILKTDLAKLHSTFNPNNKLGKLTAGITGGMRFSLIDQKPTTSFYGNISLVYTYKHIGFVFKQDYDQLYGSDTSYFKGEGKLTDKIYGRASEAYLQWSSEHLHVFLGRISRNFGMANESSLILSNNPYSYDHIGLIFENKLLKYTFIFTRLNDTYSYDIRDSLPTYSWAHRYLSFHRFDVRVSSKFEFAISESVLFGGTDQAIKFQYINPVNIFFFTKISDRSSYQDQGANAMVSFEILAKPFRKITLFSQFLIDDIDFKQKWTKFPYRLGILGKLVYSDPFPGSQISLKYNRISNWTYNSFYTWGNYTFFERSLGYPKNGDENLTLSIDYFRLAPFQFNLDILFERQRLQNLSGPFIAQKTTFPVGISQTSYQFQLNSSWFLKTYMVVSATLGYGIFQNYQNIEGNTRNFFNLMMSIKANGLFKILEK